MTPAPPAELKAMAGDLDAMRTQGSATDDRVAFLERCVKLLAVTLVETISLLDEVDDRAGLGAEHADSWHPDR